MATKSIHTHCDAGCKKEFSITKFRKRKVKNGIDKHFFRCPHCKHEYINYYASAETIKLQKEIRKLHRLNEGKQVDVVYLQKENRLKQLIKESMIQAKNIVEN